MQPKIRLLLMTVPVILFSFVSTSVFGQATVYTDKPDYHPGDTVEITGAGWQPGEIVQVIFDEVPDLPFCSGHSLTTIANWNGEIYNKQFIIRQSHLGIFFNLEATGLSSGLTAFTWFTDATITSVTTGNWNVPSTWAAASRTGTITTSTSSTTVTGSGTLFLSELEVGSIIQRTNGNVLGTVASIIDNVTLMLTANAAQSRTNDAYQAQVVPFPGDAVVIAPGTSVSVTAHAACLSVQMVNSPSNGITTTLNINSGQTLTVGGGTGLITIGNGGTGMGNNANSTTSLSVSGNLVSGTINQLPSVRNSGGGGRGSDNLTINSSGVVTVRGNVSGTSLTDNGTASASVIFSGGGQLKLTGAFTTSVFTPSTGTVIYNNSGNQTIRNATTYFNLQVDNSGEKALGGAGTIVNGTVTVNGTFANGGGVQLSGTGNIVVNNGGSFRWNGQNVPAISGTKTFDPGSTYEFYRNGQQDVGAHSYGNLFFNGTGNKDLSGNASVAGTLTLTNGIVVTGVNTLTINSTGSVNGGSATSHVNGKLARVYESTGSKTFPIGKGGNFRPLILNYTSLTGISTVTAEQIESSFASIPATVPLGYTLFTPRYWSVSQTGGTGVAYDITLDGTGFTPGTSDAYILKDNSGTTASLANATGNNYTASFSDFSNFALATACIAPVIANPSDHPQDASKCENQSVTFTVNATGTGSASFTYQWRKNGAPISNGGDIDGATSSSLTINNLATDDAGSYDVLVTRPCGANTTSNAATLTVNPNLTPSVSISQTSGSNPACAGSSVTFTATALNTGGGTVTYNFKVDNVSVQNNSSDTYITSSLASGLHSVTCEITVSGGTCLTSTTASTAVAATITINSAPTVANSISDVNFNEDASPTIININNVFADVNSESLTVIVNNNSNEELVDASYNSETGMLTLTYAANKNGSANITLRATDGCNTYADEEFVVNVAPVNDAPTVANATSDVTVNEDATNTIINLTNTFTDVDEDALTISVAGNTNSTLVAASYNSTTKELTLHYNTNKHGTATITVEASDGSLSVQDEFLVTVNSVNDEPSGTNNTVTTLEDIPYTFTAADFGFTDPSDNPANDLHSVKITTLATAGNLKLSGTDVNTGDFITAADINAGNLKFYPAADANATAYATFTFQVKDDGGIANGGADLDASANTITVDVTSVNDAPSGTDKTVTTLEDNDYTFTASDFGFNDADGNGLLSVKITTLPGAGSLTNNSIAVTAGQFITATDITNGKLKFSPAANANGNGYASFTFQVQDNGGTANGGADLDAVANTLTIDVTPVNDAPTVIDVSKSGSEDLTVSFVATDFSSYFSDVDGDLLNKIRITSLPLHGTLKLSGVNVTLHQEITTANIANLTLVPDLNYNGGISFGWNGSDGSVYAVTGALVNVTLAAVNDAPIVANAITDVTVNEDAANTVIDLTNTFADVDGNALTISVNNNSNTALLTASYNAGTKQLTLNYNANKNGTATINIRASDGEFNVDDQFDVTVRSVNDAPAGTDKTVNIDEDHSYTFSASDFGFTDPNDDPANSFLAVKITAIPANGTLKLGSSNISAGDVIPVGSIGNLVFTPANNANGSPYTSFTFQVQDDAGTDYSGVDLDPSPNTVTINVAAVNDAPIFTKGTDQTVLEDAGAQTVNNWATGIDDGDPEETQTLSFEVTNNTNPSLFSVAPSVSPTGTLTYTPAANANGSATITIKITDNGGTANSGVDESATQTFVINVTAVNDAPSFTKGADQTVLEDAGAQTVNGWATSLSRGGGSDENFQTLSFEITNNTSTALFSTQPSVDGSGNLTYTPAVNAHGIATITLKIKDNGGTANGGVDESATQSFTITVRSVNDAPSGADKTITILEDNIYTFDASDFGFADGYDDPANNFYSVKITTVPSAATGTLKNNGTTATAGSFVLAADITAGKLKFYPATNGNGSSFTSFTFQVQDDGATAYGGIDLDQSANTITFNVTPVNDVPVFTKGADQTILEDAGAQTLIAWAAGINDGDPEVIQGLTFNVSNNNTSLFSAQPSIDPATGNLTFTPSANANGSATVTVTLKDNDGTSNGGVDESAEQTFVITVTAVNDVPVFTKGANQTNLEDAGAITVNGWATGISAGPADESTQTLTFHVSNNNNGLFSVQPSVNSSTGTLTYTLAANANGSATVTVYITDNGGTANGGDNQSNDQTFTITVTSVNDAPDGADKTVAILEDHSHTFSSADFGFSDLSDNPTNLLAAVKITTLPIAGSLTNNGSTFSAGTFISVADIDAGHLVFTPAANANGSPYASFTFQVQDNGGTANSGVDLDPVANTITINVTPVNDAPVFTKGADQTVLEDAGAQTVNNWANGIDDGDPDVMQTVSFEITGNTNPSLFSVAPSVSPAGKLTYTPATNANGSATISIKITDNGGTADGGVNESAIQAFVINVTAVNDVPSFTKGADQTVNEDAGPQTVNTWAAAIDDGDAEVAQTLTFVVTNNNPALFSVQPSVSSAGTLTYTPAANANGTATVTIKLTDNGGTANGGADESAEQSFVITVRSVNDAPAGTNNAVTTLEDNPYTFSRTDFGFSDANDNPANNFLAVKVTTLPAAGTMKLNGTAISVAGTSITVADIDANKLQFFPALNANGNAYASFTFQVQDDGGTSYGGADLDPSANTMTINVTPVNDAPSFTKGGDKTVLEDAVAQTFNPWATDLLKGGGSDESSQTLSFVITHNTNTALFSAGPSISSTGVLTFTPAANANGSATITIKVMDDGGTANGGINESATQSFVINVTPVNDPPVANVNPSASQTVQYSDPITSVTLTGTDIDDINDNLSASASYSFNDGAFANGLPTGLTLTVVSDSDPKAWTLAGKMMVAPGKYIVRLKVSDDDLASDSKDITIYVNKEDARAYYTGAFFASTTSTSTNTANVQLAATIKDITAIDGITDPNAGDITNARVSFKIVETGQVISNLVPVLIDPSDTKTGIVTYNWVADIGAADSKQFTVEIKVDNYYTRCSPEDDAVVTISKPFNDFITGGGYIVLSNSVGSKAGDAGSKNNFGFNVKFNKSGTNLQGNINTIIRRKEIDGIVHVYQVKGNSMTSLSTNIAQGPGKAVFNGKASVQDITNPLNVVSVDGGASLQVTMTDMGEPGSSDRIAITVWSKTGALWFASNWDGTRTTEQTLVGGNLKVNSSSAPVTGTNPTQTAVASNLNPSLSGQSVTFTATVTEVPAYALANPTGVVTFLDGSTVIGTAMLTTAGTATFTTSSFSAGSHEINAYYSGDSKFMISSGKTTQLVNLPIASSANPRVVDNASPVKEKIFELAAYPNPTTSQFNVKLQSSNTRDAISIIVYGINGRIVEAKQKLNAGQTVQLGALYRPGVYIVEMIQSKERKQLKLVKVPD